MSENMEKALKTCRKHVQELKLKMDITGVSYDSNDCKLVFTYEAQRRVDFRELLKILQNELNVRIELKQVGPRDTAKELGGIGVCGREVCCKMYMKRFSSVTMKMLKAQGLQGNPQKYAGYCGKLRCCIGYEFCPHGKPSKADCTICSPNSNEGNKKPPVRRSGRGQGPRKQTNRTNRRRPTNPGGRR